MMRRRRRGQGGLTLVEVQMALLLFLVAILAVIELSPVLDNATRVSEQTLLGMECAQSFLEAELARSHRYHASLLYTGATLLVIVPAWTVVDTGQVPQASSITPAELASLGVGSGQLVDRALQNSKTTYEYQVARNFHPTLGWNIIVITVEVRWRDRTGQYKTFSLTGYKAKPPGDQ